MKIDFDRYIPLGIDSAGERKLLGWCLGGGTVWSVLLFLSSYVEAYRNLFVYRGVTRTTIRAGAMMPGLFEIMAGTELVLMLVCAAMPIWAAYHYFYHYSGSKAIYLMRRLPHRWELHRRCLAMPAAGLLGALSIQGILGFLYWLIYYLVTPSQCLPK